MSADVNRETDAIKKGCERDIRKVDDRLRLMEKKMWSIAGALSVICFLVSAPGQKLIKGLSASNYSATIIEQVQPLYERS